MLVILALALLLCMECFVFFNPHKRIKRLFGSRVFLIWCPPGRVTSHLTVFPVRREASLCLLELAVLKVGATGATSLVSRFAGPLQRGAG